LDAVKRLLPCECQVHPLLLVVENLHWIDTEPQAVLDTLIESLPAARPDYQHGWGSKTSYTQLRLDPLPNERAHALLDSLLGDDAALKPLKQRLIGRTAGNPLFLEESIRTLVETKALLGERGNYHLAAALSTLQAPATVQAILAARIDRLPPAEKHLLQCAAVIGREVPLALLQVIAEGPEGAQGHGEGLLPASGATAENAKGQQGGRMEPLFSRARAYRPGRAGYRPSPSGTGAYPV
jgi:predicted ATPase